ncbi:MAG: N-acetyl-gamma-glutamyl-phosphate reductase, partial [Eubacteriales bacterium]|nr:N-acetyl-gamma-glutamyl-phosphate reductase [Eubacteriales bacterium]
TGVELLRLLARHPNVCVSIATSRQEAGKRVDVLFPSLRGEYSLSFTDPEEADFSVCDAVFFATPNGIAMQQAPELLEKGIRVIDLSADFRIHDIAVWEKWYGMKHACPEIVSQAVYGLPEWNADVIKTARLVANPGCYPTAVSLPLLPLLKEGCLKSEIPLIADCKSGTSGGGRTAAVRNLLCEAGDNFQAYGVGGHRHLPEIQQTLSAFNQDIAKSLVFVPHLLPMIRGMQATLYFECVDKDLSIQSLLEDFYADSAFVDVLSDCKQPPQTRSVRGTNICRIAVQKAPGCNSWIVLSVIDNLVKGAAGQAVQNMNLMFGFPETLGLDIVPLLP